MIRKIGLLEEFRVECSRYTTLVRLLTWMAFQTLILVRGVNSARQNRAILSLKEAARHRPAFIRVEG